MTVKVAVIGGGSTYTPELADGFGRLADRLNVDELVLHDIDPARLEPVAAVCGRILRRHGWTGTLTSTTDLVKALEGAHFVLVQLRVGGQEARLRDETLPLTYGRIGQETTGAGGFGKAMRTVPVVLDLAEQVGWHAAPGAWIIDFTNPTGIVTQALVDEGHRAIGLCNVAIHLRHRAAELLGVDADRLEMEHVGLNHLTWERSAVVDGVDRMPELLGKHGEKLAEYLEFPLDLLRELGAIPSRYLRYYYLTEHMLARQQAGHLRAREVQKIESELLELYRDPTLDVKPPQLLNRGGRYYSDAAVALIASLHDGRGDVQAVNVRNNGVLPGLDDDAVIEVQARIDRDGAHPLPQRALPAEMLGLVQQMKQYERLTVQATKTRDRRTALMALMANPLVREYDPARGILDELPIATKL
ncbi:6-phospho-beta-glucosidase [Lentzea sp. JNUCC 0626]|uniref:6-phospho-beta-glucosidase n=1 Tax=Lentzea sp. JNUCC 0626 TaxID=3367513 RepID=UPI00374A6810